MLGTAEVPRDAQRTGGTLWGACTCLEPAHLVCISQVCSLGPAPQPACVKPNLAPCAQAELARAFFWRMRANGHILVIITSYQEFPGKIANPFDDRHTTPQDRAVHEAADGYLHCFR